MPQHHDKLCNLSDRESKEIIALQATLLISIMSLSLSGCLEDALWIANKTFTIVQQRKTVVALLNSAENDIAEQSLAGVHGHLQQACSVGAVLA